MARSMATVGANPFDLKYAMGGLSDDALLTNIRLYGNEVVLHVRELLASQASKTVSAVG
jgi:hypothetical protein